MCVHTSMKSNCEYEIKFVYETSEVYRMFDKKHGIWYIMFESNVKH